MNRELLEKPFEPGQIKQREGNFGKMLDYIEGHAVIQRLNDAFDSSWSFEIVKHEILTDTDEVIVLGKLIAVDIVKTQFGSSRITRARESGDMISLADDLKAAATDALKKAAKWLPSPSSASAAVPVFDLLCGPIGVNGSAWTGCPSRESLDTVHQ